MTMMRRGPRRGMAVYLPFDRSGAALRGLPSDALTERDGRS